jgi:hypothetical protein
VQAKYGSSPQREPVIRANGSTFGGIQMNRFTQRTNISRPHTIRFRPDREIEAGIAKSVSARHQDYGASARSSGRMNTIAFPFGSGNATRAADSDRI